MVFDDVERPLDEDDYATLAGRLGVRELDIEDEAILEVIDEVDNAPANGGALLRKFEIVDPDGVFEYLERPIHVYNFLGNSGFLHDFLRSEELNESIDGLNTVNGFSGYHWNAEKGSENPDFDWFYPLSVDGYLAWVIVRGGAYDSFDGTQAEAKALARQFEQAVFQDRYEEFFTWRLEDKQWSEWFEDVPHWDETLLIADSAQKLLWLFMFTSTD